MMIYMIINDLYDFIIPHSARRLKETLAKARTLNIPSFPHFLIPSFSNLLIPLFSPFLFSALAVLMYFPSGDFMLAEPVCAVFTRWKARFHKSKRHTGRGRSPQSSDIFYWPPSSMCYLMENVCSCGLRPLVRGTDARTKARFLPCLTPSPHASARLRSSKRKI